VKCLVGLLIRQLSPLNQSSPKYIGQPDASWKFSQQMGYFLKLLLDKLRFPHPSGPPPKGGICWCSPQGKLYHKFVKCTTIS